MGRARRSSSARDARYAGSITPRRPPCRSARRSTSRPRIGVRVDPSLSRRRLALCTLATGAGFAAVKLDPRAADVLAELLSHLGRHAEIMLDRTDLLCLPSLAIAMWIGRDELRRARRRPLGPAPRPSASRRSTPGR
jgi:hypothetical protein